MIPKPVRPKPATSTGVHSVTIKRSFGEGGFAEVRFVSCELTLNSPNISLRNERVGVELLNISLRNERVGLELLNISLRNERVGLDLGNNPIHPEAEKNKFHSHRSLAG